MEKYNEFYENGSRLQDNPDWTVTATGTMKATRYDYVIDSSRLGENWLEHMSEKRWVDMNTFVPAYIIACARAGVKIVEISY